MAFWSRDNDTPVTPEKKIATEVDDLMRKNDLFGVADLMCKQSPDMVRKIVPEVGYTTALEIKPLGNWNLRIGGYHNSKNVIVGSDTCRDWNK